MRKLFYLNKLLNPLGVEMVKYDARNNSLLRKKIFFSDFKFDYAIDVGANIGGFRDEIREIGYQGWIDSIEPIGKVYQQLVLKSKSDALWKIHNCALGDYNGTIEINISSNVHSSSVLDILDEHTNAEPNSKYVDKEIVPIHTLDTLKFQTDFQNAFLKIDTQGFEYNVLIGAKEVMKKCKAIQLEMSLVPLYKNQKLARDIINFMEENDFELYAIEPGFSNSKTGRQYQIDGIFVRK